MAVKKDLMYIKNFPSIAEGVIWNLPRKINKVSRRDQLYTAEEAYQLLRDTGEIDRYQSPATEDVLHAVFSPEGRESLNSAVSRIAGNGRFTTALYFCEPCVFVIGAMEKRLFILDTHAMQNTTSGLDGGVLEIFPDQGKTSVEAVCSWVWKQARSLVHHESQVCTCMMAMFLGKGLAVHVRFL